MAYHENKPYKKVCPACKVAIWMLHTSKGGFTPVNADTITNGDLMVLEATDDLIFDRTKHMSHFATCKFASRFRKCK
jgi:hypothetical protein